MRTILIHCPATFVPQGTHVYTPLSSTTSLLSNGLLHRVQSLHRYITPMHFSSHVPCAEIQVEVYKSSKEQQKYNICETEVRQEYDPTPHTTHSLFPVLSLVLPQGRVVCGVPWVPGVTSSSTSPLISTSISRPPFPKYTQSSLVTNPPGVHVGLTSGFRFKFRLVSGSGSC